MTVIEEIVNKVNSLNTPKNGFSFFEKDDVYFGKSREGYFSFGKVVENKKILPIIQQTSFLNLYINGIFDIGAGTDQNMSVVTLKSDEPKLIETFIRLSISIIPEISDTNFYEYFLSLKEIFSNSKQKSELELQGFFAELYTIKYLYENKNFDLTSFYQSQDKMKFDYSLSDVKKIEIKSTQKSVRIHHFRQEQVNTLMYDIFVFSYLLRKDDKGLSLLDLIDYCKERFFYNFRFLAHVEKFIHKITETELSELRFNENYIVSNLRIIKVEDVPKVEQTSGDGVFNIEFDSNLENVKVTSFDEFYEWLNNE